MDVGGKGHKNIPRCRTSDDVDDSRVLCARASLRPFGSAGTMGMNLLAIIGDKEPGRVDRDRCIHSHFFPDVAADIGAGVSFGTQVHLECTRFDWRSSRHFSHWDTGLPFFLISKSGRSV